MVAGSKYQSRILSILLGILFLVPTMGMTQSRFWVTLKDKENVSFDPYRYFSQKAIERRIKQNLPLNDPSDWPLNTDYVAKIKSIAHATGKESRWLNGMVIYAFPREVEQIKALPFVQSVESIIAPTIEAAMIDTRQNVDMIEKEVALARAQLNRMNGHLFHERGFNGKGIRIAVFDIGFNKTDTNPAFEHLRKNDRIVKTWDFVDNDENVYHYHSHGTMVLSCIAGKIDSIPLGLATEASFLLARTEKNSEKFAEEENWLAAAEWADKHGVDIINSSLGYTYHRYFQDQMDGITSLVARAAKMAARKGILVVNAAGNSGTSDWYYIGTPGDVDSVLTVGGISPEKNYHIGFSSFGPTADGRMKPNVCGYGHALTAQGNYIREADGTSFATPLVAGFAACAWQAKPELTNMNLFKAIEQSADLYPYFDYAHGYGVPQSNLFIDEPKLENKDIINISIEDNKAYISVDLDYKYKTHYDKNYLFYNFQGSDNVLMEYAVIKVNQEKALQFDLAELQPGIKLNVWFRGFHKVFQFEE